MQSTEREVRESATSGAWLNAAYVVLCLLSLLPFLLIANPPIVDFANHAARLSLACSIQDPAVAAMYRYQLGVIPNLAADIVNVPFCGAVGPAAVLKGLIAASLAAIYFSGWLIQRQLFGLPNAFLLLLPAIGFNLVTTMGYINFLAGIAVACLLIAAVVGRDLKFPQLFVLCNAAGLVLFFCHIFALVFAMVFFFGRAMRNRAISMRNCALAAFQTAALFVLPLLLIPFVASSGEELSIDYFGKWRVLASLFVAQHPNANIFGSLLLIPIYLLLRRGWIEIHHEFRTPLIALAVYVLVVPSGMRDAIDIDSRTAVPLAYLFFASLRPIHREAAISAAAAAASAVLLGFGLLMSVLVWRPFSEEVDELRAATSVLPAGAPVISVRNDKGDKRAALPLAYIHLASYATIDRRIFNPNEFTGVGMQPLSVTPPYVPIDTLAAVPVTSENAVKLEDPTLELQQKAKERNAQFMIRWQDRFEYVIYYHFGGPPNFDPKTLSLVHQGSFFSILKVKTYHAQ
jgi:hypothetical protein